MAVRYVTLPSMSDVRISLCVCTVSGLPVSTSGGIHQSGDVACGPPLTWGALPQAGLSV